MDQVKRSEVAQLCLTLCDPMACSPLGFSGHGILQARILQWVAGSWILPTLGSNLYLFHLLHWQEGSLPRSHLGSPLLEYRSLKRMFVIYFFQNLLWCHKSPSWKLKIFSPVFQWVVEIRPWSKRQNDSWFIWICYSRLCIWLAMGKKRQETGVLN